MGPFNNRFFFFLRERERAVENPNAPPPSGRIAMSVCCPEGLACPSLQAQRPRERHGDRDREAGVEADRHRDSDGEQNKGQTERDVPVPMQSRTFL